MHVLHGKVGVLGQTGIFVIHFLRLVGLIAYIDNLLPWKTSSPIESTTSFHTLHLLDFFYLLLNFYINFMLSPILAVAPPPPAVSLVAPA